MSQERLQKIIARAGLSSRRAAEELISRGRVRVNGAIVTELGTKVDARSDKVEVDGRRLVAEAPVYLVLHKPRGVVSTVSDPEGRPTVRELVKGVSERVFPVGRLDFHTSGVLLLTNDGEFCDGMLHPKRDVPKTYVAKVAGEMREPDRKRWEEGVVIDGVKTRPAEVFTIRYEQGKTWIEVTLYEGRNQQIRKMGDATGFKILRLARTSFAGITSEGLRPGDYRALTSEELMQLRETFGVPRRVSKRRDPLPTNATPVRGGRSPRAMTRGRRSGPANRGPRSDSAPPARAARSAKPTPVGKAMSHPGQPKGRRALTAKRPASTRKTGG